MRFAVVDGTKTDPQPGLRGTCHFCGSAMIAKCGRVVAWHWAHKSRPRCDPWWESETDWHRAWKARFPREWQEVIHVDGESGEKHIADVKTAANLVVEFQHSPITPEERESREVFYKNMMWIVDGNRGLDRSHFFLAMSRDPVSIEPLGYGLKWWGRSRLLHNWYESHVPVFFDFHENVLWRLGQFSPQTKVAFVYPVGVESVVGDCLEGRAVRAVVVAEEDAWRYRRRMIEVGRYPE